MSQTFQIKGGRMQSCDLCGRSGARFRARVAGAEGIVCERCASLGKVIEEVVERKPSEARKVERQKKLIQEKTEEVVEDIGEKVRVKREALGLKQEDLGKKISEHASMIKRIEHGYIPSIPIARKLEKALGLKLVEVVNPSEQGFDSGKSGGSLTLGDIMVIRKNKTQCD